MPCASWGNPASLPWPYTGWNYRWTPGGQNNTIQRGEKHFLRRYFSSFLMVSLLIVFTMNQCNWTSILPSNAQFESFRRPWALGNWERRSERSNLLHLLAGVAKRQFKVDKGFREEYGNMIIFCHGWGHNITSAFCKCMTAAICWWTTCLSPHEEDSKDVSFTIYCAPFLRYPF